MHCCSTCISTCSWSHCFCSVSVLRATCAHRRLAQLLLGALRRLLHTRLQLDGLASTLHEARTVLQCWSCSLLLHLALLLLPLCLLLLRLPLSLLLLLGLSAWGKAAGCLGPGRRLLLCRRWAWALGAQLGSVLRLSLCLCSECRVRRCMQHCWRRHVNLRQCEGAEVQLGCCFGK